MANTPEELRYTKEHEWTRAEADVATIGITDFAQSQLGDIVFVELPEIGDAIQAGGSFGVVESIKSVSDLYSPVSGEVTEINSSLTDEPEKLNADPYGDAWLIKIKMSDTSELDGLMNADDYQKICSE